MKQTPIKQAKELVLKSDCGLDEVNMRLARELHARFPKVREAQHELEQVADSMKRKYFKLLDAVRTPADNVKLNGREITLLLQSMGYPKSRVSEMRKVIEVADPIWAQYRDNVIGFKPLLKIARESASNPVTESEPDGPDGEEPGSKSVKTGVAIAMPLPQATQTAMCDVISAATLPNAGANWYELNYVTGGVLYKVVITTANT